MAKRKSGTGTLRKRADGRWEGWINIGRDENGKIMRKNVLARTRTECADKLRALIEGQPDYEFRNQDTFGNWLAYWYETYCKPGIRPNTQMCYENRIYNHIIPKIGQIPLRELTQIDLQKFYGELKENGRIKNTDYYGTGLSNRSVRGCHMTCYAALEKAVEEGLLSVNPAHNCKLPPKKTREMEILSHEEIQRFLIQAREDNFFEVALLELSTGMRRGEICGLRWEDLDFDTGELKIRRQANTVHGKTIAVPLKTKASERTMILPEAVVYALRKRRKRIDSLWMFPSPGNADVPCDPRNILRTMKKILKRAKCKNIRFHDLHHTFATMALENGMDIKTLSAIIGHVSAETTIDVYSHVTDKMRASAAVQIDKGIAGVKPSRAARTAMGMEGGNHRKPIQKATFQATKGKIRKPGTGGVYQINEHLFEGRYTPTNAEGKRESHNVYAHTEEECEEKLAVMIREVKARIQKDREEKKALSA